MLVNQCPFLADLCNEQHLGMIIFSTTVLHPSADGFLLLQIKVFWTIICVFPMLKLPGKAGVDKWNVSWHCGGAETQKMQFPFRKLSVISSFVPPVDAPPLPCWHFVKSRFFTLLNFSSEVWERIAYWNHNSMPWFNVFIIFLSVFLFVILLSLRHCLCCHSRRCRCLCLCLFVVFFVVVVFVVFVFVVVVFLSLSLL